MNESVKKRHEALSMTQDGTWTEPYTSYEAFKEAMDKIGEEISEASKEHKYALLYSGGVDSTAIMASMLKAKANFYLIHTRCGRDGYYDIFLEQIVMHMAMKYKLPLLFLHGFNDNYPFEYQSWKDMGITHFVTGCGTDRMYQECYYKYPEGKNPPDYIADIETFPKVLPFSKGERFRMYHPILDVLLGIRSRVYSIRQPKILMVDDWVSKWRDAEIERQGLHVFRYDTHHLMMRVMDDYKPGIKDVFDRKEWTFRYVEEFYGKSYRELCKEVMTSRRVCVQLETE